MNMVGDNLFVKSINAMKDTWLTWQGTYTSVFLLYFINPLSSFSLTRLRAILFLIVLSCIVGLVLVINMILDYLAIQKKYSIYFLNLLVMPMLLSKEYGEVYLWFTGALVYLLPVFFMFFGLTCLLLGNKYNKLLYYFIAGIFYVLMGGGVLQVVGLGVLQILILLLIDCIRYKTVNKYFLYVFVVALLAAVVNACAPGNFARHTLIDSSPINIWKTLSNTILAVSQESEILLKETYLLVALVLALLLGCKIRNKFSKMILCIGTICLLMLPIITAFPVVMGYSSGGIEAFTNRCLFVLDMSLIASYVCIAVIIGNCFGNYLLKFNSCNFAITCVMFAFILFFSKGEFISQSIPMVINSNFQNELIQNYTSTWENIFDAIRYNESDDVVIENDIRFVTGCTDMMLSEDTADWVNQDVARYFNKNTVSLINYYRE